MFSQTICFQIKLTQQHFLHKWNNVQDMFLKMGKIFLVKRFFNNNEKKMI